MARTGASPKPIVTKTVCSLCGLDWEKHPDNASALDCIALLKAEVAKPAPVTIPWKPQPLTWPMREEPPWIGGKLTISGTSYEGKGTAARY